MMRCTSLFVSEQKDVIDAVAEAEEIGIDVTSVFDRITSTLRSKKLSEELSSAWSVRYYMYNVNEDFILNIDAMI